MPKPGGAPGSAIGPVAGEGFARTGETPAPKAPQRNWQSTPPMSVKLTNQ